MTASVTVQTRPPYARERGMASESGITTSGDGSADAGAAAVATASSTEDERSADGEAGGADVGLSGTRSRPSADEPQATTVRRTATSAAPRRTLAARPPRKRTPDIDHL